MSFEEDNEKEEKNDSLIEEDVEENSEHEYENELLSEEYNDEFISNADETEEKIEEDYEEYEFEDEGEGEVEVEVEEEEEEDDDEKEKIIKLTFEDVFYIYCNTRTTAFQTMTSKIYDGILLSQSDAWLDKAKLIGRTDVTFTLTETGFQFINFRKWRINLNEFNEYLQNLCNLKNMDVNEIKSKLLSVWTSNNIKL